MGNSFLRSLLYLILHFLLCEVLLFLYLDWLGWATKGVVIYVVMFMPIMLAVHFCMHMIFLFFTSRKKNIRLPLTSVSKALLLDLVFLGMVMSLFYKAGPDLLMGVQVIALMTMLTLLVELCCSLYLRRKELRYNQV